MSDKRIFGQRDYSYAVPEQYRNERGNDHVGATKRFIGGEDSV